MADDLRVVSRTVLCDTGWGSMFFLLWNRLSLIENHRHETWNLIWWGWRTPSCSASAGWSFLASALRWPIPCVPRLQRWRRRRRPWPTTLLRRRSKQWCANPASENSWNFTSANRWAVDKKLHLSLSGICFFNVIFLGWSSICFQDDPHDSVRFQLFFFFSIQLLSTCNQQATSRNIYHHDMLIRVFDQRVWIGYLFLSKSKDFQACPN